MIDRQKRQNDRRLADVRLIRGIVSVTFVLTLFKTLRAVEHDVDDGDPCDDRDDPLTCVLQRRHAGNEHARPEEDLAEVVRAAYHLIQSLRCDHLRVFLLLRGLLLIRDRFEKQTDDGDDHADARHEEIMRRFCADADVIVAVEHRRNLRRIQHGDKDPDRCEHEDGHLLCAARILVQRLLIRLVLELAIEQKARKPRAVRDEQQSLQNKQPDCAVCPAVCERKDHHGDAPADDGKAVADRQEPYELLEADRAADCADRADNTEIHPAHLMPP